MVGKVSEVRSEFKAEKKVLRGRGAVWIVRPLEVQPFRRARPF